MVCAGRATPERRLAAGGAHLAYGRIGQTNGILSPALPERNPENTPGACQSPSPAAAARSQRSQRQRLPRHAAAACPRGAQQGAARLCALWTAGSGWVTAELRGFPGFPGVSRGRGPRDHRFEDARGGQCHDACGSHIFSVCPNTRVLTPLPSTRTLSRYHNHIDSFHFMLAPIYEVLYSAHMSSYWPL
jgi:hypothetical protein